MSDELDFTLDSIDGVEKGVVSTDTLELEQIAASSDPFPVDFDRAWQWIEYSSKQRGKEMLTKHFAEGADFLLNGAVKQTDEGSGGHNREEIRLTIDCFKSFCMMAGTEKGREVRAYFIECEQRLHAMPRPRTALEWAQAFVGAETERIRLEKQVADDAPKVAEWQSLMDSKGAQKIGTIAKCLGYGPNKFFALLRADGVLTQDNLPRSEHQHLFDVVQKILPTGRSQSVTLVKPEGMSYLARRYAQPQPIRKMELVK
jgi:phage anti-repressor protein